MSTPTPEIDWKAKAAEMSAAIPDPDPQTFPVIPEERKGPPRSGPATTSKTASSPFVWRKRAFFKGFLDAMIPTAERLKIWKRDESGQTHVVKTYTPKDLDRSNDIEEFIQTYIVPSYGPGEYEIAVLGANNEESRRDSVRVAAPLPHVQGMAPAPNDPGQASVIDRLFDRLDRLEQSRAVERPETLTDKIAELAKLKEMLGGDDKKGGGDMMTLLMLMDRVTPRDQSGAAAEIRALRAEIADLARSAAQPAPAPIPLPPMEPPVNPVEMLRAAADIARPATPAITATDVQQIVKAALAEAAPKEKLGLKEIIALAPSIMTIIDKFTAPNRQAIEQLTAQIAELSESPERKGGVKGLMEDVKSLMEFTKTLSPNQGKSDDSFVGFLREMVADFPEKLDAIGDLVKDLRKDEKEEAEHERAQRDRKARAQREDAAKKANAEYERLQREKAAAAAKAKADADAKAKANATAASASPPAEPKMAKAEDASATAPAEPDPEDVEDGDEGEPSERAERRAKRREERKAKSAGKLPEDIDALLGAITSATDDPDRVMATMNLIERLYAHSSKWKAQIRPKMILCKEDTPEVRHRLMAFLTELLEAFAKTRPAVLPSQVKEATIAAFEKHLEKVIAAIRAKLP